MARTTARPPRRKWSWILGAAVVVAALIVGVTVFYNTRTNGEIVATTAPTSSTAPTATAGGADAAPTGCLGGEARDAAMVLAAQKAAPHTSNGAVEFATAFMRWLYQYPYPSATDADQVSATAIAADAETQDLAAFFATSPNISGGLVEDGQTYYRSTIPGVWHLESFSGDEVVVSIGTGVVIDGELGTAMRGSITLTVVWEDGSWKFLSSEGTRTTEDLYAIGTAFTGGC